MRVYFQKYEIAFSSYVRSIFYTFHNCRHLKFEYYARERDERPILDIEIELMME